MKKRFRFLALSSIIILLLLNTTQHPSMIVKDNKIHLSFIVSSEDQSGIKAWNLFSKFVKNETVTVKLIKIDTLNDLLKTALSSEIFIIALHGTKEGILIDEKIVSWKKIGLFFSKFKGKAAIFLSCYSSNLRKFWISGSKLYTYPWAVDPEVSAINGVYALASLLSDDEVNTHRLYAENLTLSITNYVWKNIGKLLACSFFPNDTLGDNVLILPSKSGYGGPIGFILDLILGLAPQEVAVGGSYQFTAEPKGSKNKFGTANTVIKLKWNAFLNVKDSNTFRAGFTIKYSTNQTGFINILLNTLLQGAEISVEGKGEVEAEVKTENWFNIKDWLLSIDIRITKSLGLGDIICKLWSAAKNAIEKIPNLKKALNAIEVGVYIGGKFQAFPDIPSGEDVFEVTLYFGVCVGVDLSIATLQGGIEADFDMQFQASGNDFAIIISFSIGIEALEGLFTWEKLKKYLMIRFL